jgi:hypothetical protein
LGAAAPRLSGVLLHSVRAKFPHWRGLSRRVTQYPARRRRACTCNFSPPRASRRHSPGISGALSGLYTPAIWCPRRRSICAFSGHTAQAARRSRGMGGAWPIQRGTHAQITRLPHAPQNPKQAQNTHIFQAHKRRSATLPRRFCFQ